MKANTSGSGGLSGDYFDEAFASGCVMAILRGLPPDHTVDLCGRLWRAGIGVVEVPIQGDDAVASLRAAVDAGREAAREVGAGTVISTRQVQAAADAGAAFTVAPGLDGDVASASCSRGLPHLPGVATPSDVQSALRLGFRWLKAFPARQLTPGWFTAMRGPFPEIRLVATGGIDGANAEEFLAAGADVLAVGSAIAVADTLRGLAAINKRGAPQRR